MSLQSVDVDVVDVVDDEDVVVVVVVVDVVVVVVVVVVTVVDAVDCHDVVDHDHDHDDGSRDLAGQQQLQTIAFAESVVPDGLMSQETSVHRLGF